MPAGSPEEHLSLVKSGRDHTPVKLDMRPYQIDSPDIGDTVGVDGWLMFASLQGTLAKQ